MGIRPKEYVLEGVQFHPESILTTVGIVYGLTTESLNFFTQELWEDTNKQTVQAMSAVTTSLGIAETGKRLSVGDRIRLSEEIMEIVDLDGNVMTVERGLSGTEAVAHKAGTDIFVSQRVTLGEFFTGTKWNPQIGQFGIWPLVTATLMTSMIAMIVALPIGLCAAIYLSEYASPRTRRPSAKATARTWSPTTGSPSGWTWREARFAGCARYLTRFSRSQRSRALRS